MQKKLKKLYFLFWSLIFFAFSLNPAAAFENLYQKLDQIIIQSHLKKKQALLSVVFDSKIGSESIDKIKLKKTIVTNIAHNYRLTNPIETKQLLKTIQIQNIESLKNKSGAKKFFSAAKTNILIYTKLQEEGDVVIVSYRILGKNNSSVEIATQSFSKTQFSKQIAKPETQPILLASTGNNLGGLLAQQNLEDLFEQPTQAIDDFVNKEILFAENGNSWSFYLPTAYFPARTHSLEVNFSVEDLRFAQVSGEAYRYLWGNSFFEFSTNLQTRNSSLYQGFVGVKASIFQGNAVQSPFKLALGLRTLWQKSSTENESTADTSKEDERKKLRRLSFFTAISGNISDTNMLYNIYLDNYTLGGGVKLKLPYKIFLFVDGRVDYESEANETFLALGFEHFPANTVGYALAYKTENRKIENYKENSSDERGKETTSLLVFSIKVSF